jgi:hypothetical protein
MRELGESIAHTIGSVPEHAGEQQVISGSLAAEGDEVETLLPRGTVGDASPEDLELGAIDAYLDSRDVCRWRLLRARKLDAVGLGAADHPLLFIDGKLVEGDEIMHPAHRQSVAAALPG